MRNAIALIAGAISIISAIPYLVDIAREKTRPNAISWFTWTLLNTVNALAAWHTGAIQTCIFSTAAGVATGAILILGFRHGVKCYTPFDIFCQVMALVGIILWQLTHNPNLAVLINLCADAIGLLPTLRHAVERPYEETWQMFGLGFFAAGLTLTVVQHYTFISVAAPAYICLSNALLTVVILIGRKPLREQARSGTADRLYAVRGTANE